MLLFKFFVSGLAGGILLAIGFRAFLVFRGLILLFLILLVFVAFLALLVLLFAVLVLLLRLILGVLLGFVLLAVAILIVAFFLLLLLQQVLDYLLIEDRIGVVRFAPDGNIISSNRFFVVTCQGQRITPVIVSVRSIAGAERGDSRLVILGSIAGGTPPIGCLEQGCRQSMVLIREGLGRLLVSGLPQIAPCETLCLGMLTGKQQATATQQHDAEQPAAPKAQGA